MHSTRGKSAQDPFSPSGLNRLIKKRLTEQFGRFWLAGEVMEHFRSRAGHQYFSIKDENAGIRCVLFKQQNVQLEIKAGMQITVYGQVSLYTPKGDLQVMVSAAMASGLGSLEQQRAQLIEELKSAGLLDPARKKAIPPLVENLAIVTSPDAAGFKDALDVFLRKNPLLEITLYPTLVQGTDAPAQVIQALQQADSGNADVVLLCRGGGSKEDLWCFNDRILAYQIAQMQKPTITAIGHETDESIADMVADLSCITPTAAAEQLSGGFEKLKLNLQHNQQMLQLLIRDQLRSFQQRLDAMDHQLKQQHPHSTWRLQSDALKHLKHQLKEGLTSLLIRKQHHLDQIQNRLQFNQPNTKTAQHQVDRMDQKLHMVIQNQLTTSKHQLKQQLQTLNLHNPLHILARGYSITTKAADQTVVTDVSQLELNEAIETRLKSGKIRAKIFERIEDDAL